MVTKWLCTFMLIMCLSKTDAARILAIVPVPSYSHQIVFQPIWRALSLRGHELVLLTVNPMNDSTITNLTEIDLSFSYEVKKEHNLDSLINGKESGFSVFQKFTDFGIDLHSRQLEHPDVQRLLNEKSQHFDLVMFEFMSPIFGAFAYKYKCPYIGFQSVELGSEVYSAIGNPQHPAVLTSFIFPFYKDLSFLQRLQSTAFQFMLEVFLVPNIQRASTEVVRKYFGKDSPDVVEIVNNVDIVFQNVNPVLKMNKPSVPALIEFGGGFHIQPLKPLPKDINDFFDASETGVIYFSLGSNVLSEFVSNDLVKVILETFEALPYNVLWKFEQSDFIVPENVKILKWVPQQDILRHPKSKLFISQCGLQSLEETLYSHVPIICMPFFADQPKNAIMISELGIGVKVDKDTLTKEMFKQAIVDVISNPKGGGAFLFLLEITWVVGAFLQLCVRNDQHRIFRCWSVVQWFEAWKKTLVYGPLGALPIVFPHKLWLSYVAGGQLISLAAFHLVLSFKGPRRRRRKDRLLHPDIDSYESSRFEEVTEVLDDGLPEPMPGSSHSLSDSLAEQDTILEI